MRGLGPDAIQMVSGEYFYPLDARPEEVKLDDIAFALSNQCRFSGHVKKFYSVAEHSVRVAKWIENNGGTFDEIRTGLMHDASEAYLVDVPRPLKRASGFGELYLAAEEDLQEVIAQAFGLPYPFPEIVHTADTVLLSTEQRDLMPKGPAWYPDVERLKRKIYPWTPLEARVEFTEYAKELGLCSVPVT